MKCVGPIFIAAFSLTLGALRALATDFYVSSSTGQDDNVGTSEVRPWKTFGNVNRRQLKSGDRIYLKAGDVFNNSSLTFSFGNSGQSQAPVIVDRYGLGSDPVIVPAQDSHAISIHNTGGITVRHLSLLGSCNPTKATPQFGISLWCDSKTGEQWKGVRLEGIHIQGFYKGIVVGAADPSMSGFSGITIVDCVVQSCIADGIVSFGNQQGHGTYQSHHNINVIRTIVHDCYGDPSLNGPHSGSGIIISGASGGLIDQCVAHDNGGGVVRQRTGGGPVGIWCWGCDAIIIQHCLVFGQHTTKGVQDGGGFDIDGGATHCVIQYCCSHDNEGYGFLVCEFPGAKPLSGAVVRYNVSWNDGLARNQAGLGIWNGNSSTHDFEDVVFYNNTIVGDSRSRAAVRLGEESAPVDAAFYNNIFVRTEGGSFVVADRPPETLVFAHNLYWTPNNLASWDWDGVAYGSLGEWRKSRGHPETFRGTETGRFADPLFRAFARGLHSASLEDAFSSNTLSPEIGGPSIHMALNLSGLLPSWLPDATQDYRGSSLARRGSSSVGAYQQ
jgi:Right handed beta helix region